MELAEELSQTCDSSNPNRVSIVAEEEPVLNEPLNESDKDANGDSNDVLDNEGEKQTEDQNEVEWDEYSDDDEDESEDEDVDESEIDTLLEQGLPKSKRLEKAVTTVEQRPTTPGKCPARAEANHEPTIKRITILDEKDENAFEVLPGDWIKVRHSSGLPLYLHRPTRVCTLAKPYYLGPASVRRHSVPLSAIPCLAYRRGLEKEQRDKELLEEQAKELENPAQNVSGDTRTDIPANNSNETSSDLLKKFPLLMNESITHKISMLKRKHDMDKESSEAVKRGKNDGTTSTTIVKEEPSSQEVTLKDIPANPSSEVKQTETSKDNSSKEVTGKHVNDNTTIISKYLRKTEIPLTLHKRLNSKRGHENIPGIKSLIPLAKVETARENASLYSVPPLELREYCKSLFRFSVVECKRFKTWSARRMHSKEQKRKQLERPTLPDNAQVIKFFDISESKGGDEQLSKKYNDYVFNPNGKSSVCILHEFVQHALRKQPTYAFQELENAATPYAATVMINNIPYGKGLGSSKRTAKAAAAKATLEILIPQMKGQLNGNKSEPGSDFDITEYFQQVGMNDVRIAKLCASVSEPSPYTLLLTCLQRNYGQSGSSGVQFDMIPTDLSKGNPPNQFKMTAGKETVVVTASNKREGKQLASQLLLSKLHPHIRNFGAFIKMYGNGSIKSVKEKKQEEQQITTLQSKASANSPNWAILDKLRSEMLKLAEQEKSEKEGANENVNVTERPSSTSRMDQSPSNISDANENVVSSVTSESL